MSSSSDDEVIPRNALTPFLHNVPFNHVCDHRISNEESNSEASDDPTTYDFDVESYEISQYVQGVVDFSSQYGSIYSISYTAPNITGKPSKFPLYGDFPETYAMRTYGDWWLKAPSHVEEFQPQNFSKIPVHDFIVVCFESYIIPRQIIILETYNPGAIVRIWAYTIARTWEILWEIKDFSLKQGQFIQKPRRFIPPINKLHLPTNTLRLEFNHTHLNYFTEIDAVLFCGRHVSMNVAKQMLRDYQRWRRGSIMSKLQTIRFKPKFNESKRRLQDFIENDLKKFVPEAANIVQNAEMGDTVENDVEAEVQGPKPGLLDMPFEILQKIIGELDLITLFKLGAVSRYMYEVTCHPYFYTEVNLKTYWHSATTDILCTLAKRATNLKRLDLSWCGLYNTITATEFKKFIFQRGKTITHLRLNSCKFLNGSCIEQIGICCDNLKELSLRNLSTDPPNLNFTQLCNLKHLERLDLFQTLIEPTLLLKMLENNPKLKHLNLAFAGVAVNMDDVTAHIAKYNRELVSIDLWKCHFLSAAGVQSLSNCHELEEVDLGWSLREGSVGDALLKLIINCPKLKKLFLATVRGLTDTDISNIANICQNLEQLDLMGATDISKERYLEVLTKCTKLKLLDLSFCDNIHLADTLLWSRDYNVKIKCSNLNPQF